MSKANNIKNPQENLSRRQVLKSALFGSAAAKLSPYLWITGCRPNKKPKGPNIILITLDTTRADHLSCYGYHRRTCPNLDKLAEKSVLYTNAIAPSSWTLPSHASLFTGKFTASHGAKYDPNGPLKLIDAITGPQSWGRYRVRGLAHNEVTLAMILKDNGYRTAAFAGGPWLKKVFGFDKGFDYYDDNNITSINGRDADDITKNAIKWILGQQNNFFLFLNYFDPHFPFVAPEEFGKIFVSSYKQYTKQRLSPEDYIGRYDAEILYMDHHIGLLLNKLKKDNLFDKTMIIITADHGELLGEYGKKGHGKYLSQPELHIPLFIKYPGSEVSPTTKKDPVQLNDLFAMILNYFQIPVPKNTQSGVPPDIGHPVLAETYPLAQISPDGHWRALFVNNFKFVWNSKGNHQLFNLANDPQESVSLIQNEIHIANRLRSSLDKYIATLPKPGPADPGQKIDDETIKSLKGLGYIN